MKTLRNNIILAEAVPIDVEELISLQQKMAQETEGLSLNEDILRKGILAVLEDEQKGKYYKMLEGGKIVGCMLNTYEWSDWRNAYIIWIQSLYILPDYRNKGIFRQVYEYLQGKVKGSIHFKGIRLYVDKSNNNAIKVYEQLGMSAHHYQLYEWLT